MSNEFICIIFLAVLYVYQCYRFWKLKNFMQHSYNFMLKQMSEMWNFQHGVVDTLDMLKEKIEDEH